MYLNLLFLANHVVPNFGNKLTTRWNLPFLVNHVVPNFGKLTTHWNLPITYWNFGDAAVFG